MQSLPLELIHQIASDSPQTYHTLVLAYPYFARSLTLGDRLDFAEKFGYDCRVEKFSTTFKIVWYLNDKLHRTDGPAVEYASGTKHWYINEQLHRVNGPAIEHANGSKKWLLNGKFHRTDGPAVEYAGGSAEWYINGKHHRIGGPAIEHPSGHKEWYVDGKCHRVGGTAYELADGTAWWYLDDKRLSEDDYRAAISNNTP